LGDAAKRVRRTNDGDAFSTDNCSLLDTTYPGTIQCAGKPGPRPASQPNRHQVLLSPPSGSEVQAPSGRADHGPLAKCMSLVAIYFIVLTLTAHRNFLHSRNLINKASAMSGRSSQQLPRNTANSCYKAYWRNAAFHNSPSWPGLSVTSSR